MVSGTWVIAKPLVTFVVIVILQLQKYKGCNHNFKIVSRDLDNAAFWNDL